MRAIVDLILITIWVWGIIVVDGILWKLLSFFIPFVGLYFGIENLAVNYIGLEK